MIYKEDIERETKKILKEEQFFVDAKINNKNEIIVHIDDYNGLNIDACKEITKELYNSMGNLLDDYSLEISSPGLSNPFVVMEQYKKNIGKNVEILMKDGEKINRKILSIENGILTVGNIEVTKKGKEPIIIEEKINLLDIKTTKNIISFK